MGFFVQNGKPKIAFYGLMPFPKWTKKLISETDPDVFAQHPFNSERKMYISSDPRAQTIHGERGIPCHTSVMDCVDEAIIGHTDMSAVIPQRIARREISGQEPVYLLLRMPARGDHEAGNSRPTPMSSEGVMDAGGVD